MFTRSNRLTCIGTLCAMTCLVMTGAPSHCQEPSNAPVTQGDAPVPMAFDNVQFYPDSTEDNGQGFLWWSCPYWMFSGVSSSNLIANAYGVGMHQVIGFPKWAETDRYHLYTKMDLEKYEAFKSASHGRAVEATAVDDASGSCQPVSTQSALRNPRNARL